MRRTWAAALVAICLAALTFAACSSGSKSKAAPAASTSSAAEAAYRTQAKALLDDLGTATKRAADTLAAPSPGTPEWRTQATTALNALGGYGGRAAALQPPASLRAQHDDLVAAVGDIGTAAAALSKAIAASDPSGLGEAATQLANAAGTIATVRAQLGI